MTASAHTMAATIHVAPCGLRVGRTASAWVAPKWLGALRLLAPLWLGLPQAGVAQPDAIHLSAPSPLPQAQLRLVLTPRTTMVYEPRRLASPLAMAADGQVEAPPSVGLEFRSPPSHTGARAVLRVQLSGNAALQFRPRKGGLAISYRNQF